MTKVTGRCTCGEVQFQSERGPLFRAICHCSICRSFHGRDFGDFLVIPAKGFAQAPGGEVDYKVYKQPPLLKRGKCRKCDAPVLETLTFPPFPKMMLIPSRWIAEQEALPAPSFHMFYNNRVADAADDLPKCSGYLPSQVKFSTVLTGALLGGDKAA